MTEYYMVTISGLSNDIIFLLDLHDTSQEEKNIFKNSPLATGVKLTWGMR